MDEAWDDVAIFDGEVVVGAVDVRGDDRSEVATIFFSIAFVHHVNHLCDRTKGEYVNLTVGTILAYPLGIGIAFIAEVGRSAVHHRLIDRISGLIGKDTG